MYLQEHTTIIIIYNSVDIRVSCLEISTCKNVWAYSVSKLIAI